MVHSSTSRIRRIGVDDEGDTQCQVVYITECDKAYFAISYSDAVDGIDRWVCNDRGPLVFVGSQSLQQWLSAKTASNPNLDVEIRKNLVHEHLLDSPDQRYGDLTHLYSMLNDEIEWTLESVRLALDTVDLLYEWRCSLQDFGVGKHKDLDDFANAMCDVVLFGDVTPKECSQVLDKPALLKVIEKEFELLMGKSEMHD